MTTPSRLPKPYTADELERLATAVRHRPELNAACSFLLETGLRSHEFASIPADLARTWPKPHRWCRRCRRHRAVLRVIGKGNRERMVPLGAPALRAAHTLLATSNGHLWGFSERTLRLRLQEAGATVGVHAHPHRFRHTAATRWIDRGVDPYLVADLLGHSSLATTKLYTALSETRMFDAILR